MVKTTYRPGDLLVEVYGDGISDSPHVIGEGYAVRFPELASVLLHVCAAVCVTVTVRKI